jgi:hypothetical protein
MQIVGVISASGLDENCLELAFSASPPRSGAFAQSAFERFIQGRLISEAALACNFRERQS